MERAEMLAILDRVAREYPPDMVEEQLRDIPRTAFHVGLVIQAIRGKAPAQASICDLGGGLGLFSVACAAVGFKRVILVDDFNDAVNHRVGDSLLELHRQHGVQIVSEDIITGEFDGDFLNECDAVTSFESMEHWHHSPKRLFRKVMSHLPSGGAFILNAPNCVNLRKRLTIPLGIGKWSRMQEWYESETFRGHVREPDVNDLKYIARDMGLTNVRIIGRNWSGYRCANPTIRLATRMVDHVLRAKPSLCSDIYLVGNKG